MFLFHYTPEKFKVAINIILLAFYILKNSFPKNPTRRKREERFFVIIERDDNKILFKKIKTISKSKLESKKYNK